MSGTESFVMTSAKRLFGLGRSNADLDPAKDAEAGERPSIADQAKRHLLDTLAEFFMVHGLHLNGPRLMLAHDLFAGRDRWLKDRYAERKASGHAITDQWLEQVECDHALQNRSQLNQLMTEFEGQLGQFAANARQTRLAAEGYGSKLTDAATDIDSQAATPEALARLAQQMMDQTRDLVLTMKASELQSARLQQRLEQAKLASETDALTGLPNRRAFEQHFERAVDLARTGGYPVCVAFCDLDNFKRVNDQHGHDAGDRVLRKVALELGSLVSSRSFVSRHGGEEFVILFSHLDLKAAKARLDEIRTRLGATELCNRSSGETIGCVTFSAGIVEVMDYASPRDALRAADAAMYIAKKSGKNQIHCGHPPH